MVHTRLKTLPIIQKHITYTDPKTIQQINFAGILNQGEDVNDNSTMFFIIEEAKKITLDLSQDVGKYCNFIFFCYDINIK